MIVRNGASQVAHVVKNLLANAGLSLRRHRFDPQVEKIPWRRKWQPIAVFLPGKSHGWRSLEGYIPWSHKESDTTKRLHFKDVENFNSINYKVEFIYLIIEDSLLSMQKDQSQKLTIHSGE